MYLFEYVKGDGTRMQKLENSLKLLEVANSGWDLGQAPKGEKKANKCRIFTATLLIILYLCSTQDNRGNLMLVLMSEGAVAQSYLPRHNIF